MVTDIWEVIYDYFMSTPPEETNFFFGSIRLVSQKKDVQALLIFTFLLAFIQIFEIIFISLATTV